MLTTAANVIDELQIDSSRTAFITRLINQAGAAIERHCDRSFARATTTEIITVRRTVRSDLRLVLPRKPLISVASIIYTDTGVTVSSSDYSIEDADRGILYRADGWSGVSSYAPTSSAFFNDRQPVETRYSVTYTAGYDPAEGPVGSPASPMPADLERACIDTVKDYWFAATRDPRLKLEEVAGVGRQDFWVGTRPDGSEGALSANVIGLLSTYCQFAV